MSTLDQQPLERPTQTTPAPPDDKPAAQPPRVRKRRHPLLRWGLPALLAAILGGALGAGFAATINVPEVASITELNPGLVTELSDRDQRIFRTYFNQRRQLLRSDEVPEVLRNALLASEDSRFFDHGGVDLFGILEEKAGRVLYGGFPTGVEVCPAMQHGGPYPSTTDSRTTSVGTAAIERFLRPVAYQSYPQSLLPAELQDGNPTGILRLVENEWSRD